MVKNIFGKYCDAKFGLSSGYVLLISVTTVRCFNYHRKELQPSICYLRSSPSKYKSIEAGEPLRVPLWAMFIREESALPHDWHSLLDYSGDLAAVFRKEQAYRCR